MAEQQEQEVFLSISDCKELATLLSRKYAGLIQNRYFDIEVARGYTEILVKVTLRNQSGSFYYPVEARLKRIDYPRSAREAGMFLLDYVGSYFDEYLRSGGEVYLPIDWVEYECDGVIFQLKGQILNLELEQLADRWLEGKVTETL